MTCHYDHNVFLANHIPLFFSYLQAWNVWKFDRTIADIEPHQGVPRLVTSSRQSRSSSLIRRGLAFMIEHGFYNTDQGRETFALNLKQITDA